MEFADKLEVDPSTLAKWERGERKQSGAFLMKIIAEIDSSIEK
jgi:DNA-binding transcriptional regulator YiaG